MEKFIKNFGEKLNFAFTGIGSFPFSDENAPDTTIDCVFSLCKNFPFWPQLPHFRTEENMALQFSQGLKGFKYNKDNNKFSINNVNEFTNASKKIDYDYKTIISSPSIFEYENILDKYKISPPYSNTFNIFLNKIKTLKNRPPFIKGTITGPFTFLKNFCEIKYDIKNIKDITAKFLALKALWQIKEFKKISDTSLPVIFIDEPALAQVNPSFIKLKNEISAILKTISNSIQKFNALSGVHCCGITDWEIVTSSKPDIINFDAYFYSENISNYSKHIEKFLKDGGFLALGIIPTNGKELLNLDVEKVYEKFQSSIEILSKNIDKSLILKQSFITPGCGCSSLSPDLAIKTLHLAKELSAVLKKENEVKV